MAVATASVHANQALPRLRLVQPPLDLDSLAATWQVALDAAERAIAASAASLQAEEVGARRERLQAERLALAAELRRFARVVPQIEPGAPGGSCRSADAWLSQYDDCGKAANLLQAAQFADSPDACDVSHVRFACASPDVRPPSRATGLRSWDPKSSRGSG